MPTPAILLALIAVAAAPPEGQPITVVARPWAPFISPMGEPFRARSAADDTLARWFQGADRNRDGWLTSDEMRADAERFFATLDTDGNGAIWPEELARYEWEVAPEIQVNARWRRARGEPAPVRKPGTRQRDDDGYRVHGFQGAARYTLLNIPQPVASADTNFDRSITLDEFRRAAVYRFQLLDTTRRGSLSLQQLQGRVPVRPKDGSRIAREKDERDSRIANRIPVE